MEFLRGRAFPCERSTPVKKVTRFDLLVMSQARPPSTSCRANMAHTRQSRPDSGLRFQAKALKTFEGDPFLLGGGTLCLPWEDVHAAFNYSGCESLQKVMRFLEDADEAGP